MAGPSRSSSADHPAIVSPLGLIFAQANSVRQLCAELCAGLVSCFFPMIRLGLTAFRARIVSLGGAAGLLVGIYTLCWIVRVIVPILSTAETLNYLSSLGGTCPISFHSVYAGHAGTAGSF